jgi:hypothetical protein
MILIGSVYAVFAQNAQPVVMAFFGLLGATIFGYFGLLGGRSNWLRADEQAFSYHPSFGSAKVFARDQLAKIVRVPGVKGTTSLEFRTRDGKVLLEAGDSFSRPDVERLAHYLNAPLQWDFR